MLGKSAKLAMYCRWGCCSNFGFGKKSKVQTRRSQRAKEKRVPLTEW